MNIDTYLMLHTTSTSSSNSSSNHTENNNHMKKSNNIDLPKHKTSVPQKDTIKNK